MPFSADLAIRALKEAGQSVGINVADAKLLRLGENAVFRLGDEMVARVARAHAEDDVLRRLVDVSRWLEHEHVPAVRLVNVEQPVAGAGLAVTFWHSLGDDAPYGTALDLAVLLNRLHQLQLPARLNLPELRPFDRAERRLSEVPIFEEDRAFLRRRLVDLRAAYSGLIFKMSAAARTIPCAPPLVQLLREHLADFPPAPGAHIFRGRYGGTITENTYSRIWHAARTRALTPQEVGSPLARRPYDLRHAAVSTWLAAGVDSAQVASWAGHSVQVLHRVYAQVVSGRHDGAIRAIEAALDEQR